MTQADVTSASLPITLREPVRGSRWGSKTLEMSGLERLRAVIEGRLPESPSMRLSGLRPSEVGAGVATFTMPASPWWQSATGVFLSGTLAFVADAAASAAVLTTVSPGTAIVTSQLAIDFLRSATIGSQVIIARGRMIHSTRSLGLAEVTLEDGRGRILAHGSARCVVMHIEPKGRSTGEHRPVDPTPDESPDPHQRPLEGTVRGPELWNTTSGLERLREVAREGYPTPVTRLTGIRIIEVADGDITCAMAASGWLMNYGGTIYGGAIALLGEGTATAAVLSTLPAATACAPIGLNINLLRPVRPHPGEITARARVVHRGRTIAIVQCEMSAEGKVVAMANASVLILPGRSWDEPVHVAEEIDSAAIAT